jgi:hypothetical protein
MVRPLSCTMVSDEVWKAGANSDMRPRSAVVTKWSCSMPGPWGKGHQLAAGLTLRYAPAAVVFHRHRTSAWDFFIQQLGWAHGS